MRRFLTLKHWQLFVLLVGIPMGSGSFSRESIGCLVRRPKARGIVYLTISEVYYFLCSARNSSADIPAALRKKREK
jgi:hypothetical protein